jgi:hypothetical protein
MTEENKQNEEQPSLNKIHFQPKANEDRPPSLLALIGRGILWSGLIILLIKFLFIFLIIFYIAFSLFAVCVLGLGI